MASGLEELMPYGDFRRKLDEAEKAHPEGLGPEGRKTVLVDAFGESLARLGNYAYVAETSVLRPLTDRPLYCLFYATRHPKGIEIFRDCQIKALTESVKMFRRLLRQALEQPSGTAPTPSPITPKGHRHGGSIGRNGHFQFLAAPPSKDFQALSSQKPAQRQR